MEISLAKLNLQKESNYFIVVLLISIVVWFFIVISIVGLFYVFLFMFFGWLGNGLFVAFLKSNCVKVTEEQMPELHKAYLEVCGKLELKDIPEFYVTEAGGALNAFAFRHVRRRFIVVFSDFIESTGQYSDEIKFILAHEVGHIKSKHLISSLFLFPGLIFPLIGTAYSRARESSCDRYGAFVTENKECAVRAMMILSGGKELGKDMNPKAFAQQHVDARGFFVSWNELISGYPTLSRRVSDLIFFKDQVDPPRVKRNPFAYLLAFFSFGGGNAGGNFIVTVAIVAFLAAIAIPNVMRAKISANEALAQSTLKMISTASETYATANDGDYPDDIDDLVNAATPYLNSNYCDSREAGYSYDCSFSLNQYVITASPISPSTGTRNFKISTGGVLESKVINGNGINGINRQ